MGKSKVVLVRSLKLNGDGTRQQDILVRMLDRGLSELYDLSPQSAWKSLSESTGILGLKTNCVAGKNLSTSVALTAALTDRLQDAGKKGRDVVIWERSNRELENAGFKLNFASDGIRCFGTDTRDIGYGNEFHTYGRVGSLVTRIVESECDNLINLPILKDHSLAGVSGAMKNNYGVVHNPNKYHDNNCDPYVAEVNALPVIKEKSVLVVADLTRIQYNGGPGYRSGYVVNYGGILLAVDAVAADRIGEEILNDYREENGLRSLAETGRDPKWLGTAEEIGLGNAHMENIDLVKIRVD